ncbi:MAG: hypothetical protein IPP90_22385 [Gemmatimonadaceae bacterium]|nr:hypothetical protein [Gemmatimonadaceae bacterium]
MRLLTWLFFATLSLILMLQLRGFDETLRTVDTPGGIVGYELAWSATQASTYLDAWRLADALEIAKVSLGIDFAFLLAYPLMFATGVALLLRVPPAVTFDRVGAVLRRAVLLCIPLDATENLALWRMIDHGASDTLAHLAAACASVKFLLVIVTALWCLAAVFRRFILRRPTHAA